MKFVIATCAAFFERQKPVSTSMKPACMKKISATPMITKNMFVPMLRCPSAAPISAIVGLPAVAAVIDEMSPVAAPFGSPAPREAGQKHERDDGENQACGPPRASGCPASFRVQRWIEDTACH